MTDAFAALGLGVLAGWAVALPVGPVSLLVLQEGLVRGLRSAAAAAVGVASVDVVYAVAATLAGAGVQQALAGHTTTVRVTSAAVLMVVAAAGLRSALAGRSGAALGGELAMVAEDSTAAAGPTPAGDPRRVASWRTCARFVALTAVNPLTAVAFVTVAVALGARLGAGARVTFVIGVGVASVTWQLTLATAGALVGARVGGRTRTVIAVAGNTAVVVLALVVAAS